MTEICDVFPPVTKYRRRSQASR